MVASTVSSKFLGAMAATEGFEFRETLTGFKWMGNAMAEAEASSMQPLFAFEEAIGFCCGATVRDKDGISAAAVCAEMALALAREGLSLSSQLALLQAKYGTYLSSNGYVFVDAPAKTAAIFERLCAEGHYWAVLGQRSSAPLRVTAVRDLKSPGFDSEQKSGRPSLATSSSSNMLTYKVSPGGAGAGSQPTLLRRSASRAHT
jgi:phosphomannomutase